jgi:hypothetical protein
MAALAFCAGAKNKIRPNKVVADSKAVGVFFAGGESHATHDEKSCRKHLNWQIRMLTTPTASNYLVTAVFDPRG